MTEREFQLILEQAIAGNKDCIEMVLNLYMPLINRHCYINGRLDEDMRQAVLIAIVKYISKFSI